MAKTRDNIKKNKYNSMNFSSKKGAGRDRPPGGVVTVYSTKQKFLLIKKYF